MYKSLNTNTALLLFYKCKFLKQKNNLNTTMLNKYFNNYLYFGNCNNRQVTSYNCALLRENNVLIIFNSNS